jgi:hypothetical protein
VFITHESSILHKQGAAVYSFERSRYDQLDEEPAVALMARKRPRKETKKMTKQVRCTLVTHYKIGILQALIMSHERKSLV